MKMSEQQRVVIAVVICVGILFAWQFFFSPPPPTEEPQAQRSDSEIAGKNEPVPVKADSIMQAPAGEIAETKDAVETERFRGELSNRDASITKFELAKYEEAVWVREGDELKQDRTREQPVSLVTASSGGEPRQARILLDAGGKEITIPFAKADDGTFFGATPEGFAVRVAVAPSLDKYALAYTVSITNQGEAAQLVGAKVVLGLEQRGGAGSMFSPAPDQVHGLCSVDGSIKRKSLKDVDDETYSPKEATNWGGIDRQYFLLAILPQGSDNNRCTVRSTAKTLWLDYVLSPEQVAPGAKAERAFTLYAGPKRNDEMSAVSPLLHNAIDYSLWGIPLGFLAKPMVFLMNLFHGWFSSWGLAIISLTVLVKLILFPITYRSVASMKKMQLLKPELDKLKKQFEGDKERQQLEQMKLFREKGVNPIGGCLPMLAQMPVWFALYRMLWSSVDLYHQPFLWIRDLTHAEVFPIMAILVGGLTFVQQKTTPTQMDSQQMKMMMYVMPVMFSVFLIALPSGLVLYILVNSILTIVQQLAINRRTIPVAS